MTLSDYKQQDSLLGKQWNDALNSELKNKKNFHLIIQYFININYILGQKKDNLRHVKRKNRDFIENWQEYNENYLVLTMN